MVRANGQRDGVGKTSVRCSAFEHTKTILDSTRVSPYGPAARDMPQAMRPDTRQHLTACAEPSDEMELPETAVHGFGRAQRPSLRSEASTSRTVARGCQAAARLLHSVAALRVTAAGDRAGSPCGPARRLALIPRKQSRRRGAACLLVSPPWTDFGRSTPWRPGWERRGWRWSDREPLGRTGPERSLVATVFSHGLNGYTSVRARKQAQEQEKMPDSTVVCARQRTGQEG